MSSLYRGVLASPTRSLFERNIDPLIVSSIVGLSSINGSPYSPGGGGGGSISEFSTLSVSSMTVSSFVGYAGALDDITVSSINGKPFPPEDYAYLNCLSLSSVNLPAGSTFLVNWTDKTVDSNINFTGTDIVVGASGLYKIGASYQFNNQSSSDVVRFFFLKNDTPIANTASFQTIANNTELVVYSEILDTLGNGDKIQMGLFTASSDVYLSTLGSPSAEVPVSPAAIGTIYKLAP